jgi:hypothetical protein
VTYRGGSSYDGASMRAAPQSALRILTLFAILFMTGSFADVTLRGNAATPKSPEPLWEVDLTKYGFQGRPPIPLRQEDSWGTSTYQQGVVFTDNRIVAAFFVVHQQPPNAPVDRSPLPSDQYFMVAVFLDASSGQLIQKHQWAVPSSSQDVEFPYLFPTTNGRFIAGNREGFSLYSRDFQVLAKHDASAPGVGIGVVMSPAGDTVLTHETEQIDGKWTSRFNLLDASQLSSISAWQDDPVPHQALSGREVAWFNRGSVYLKTPDTSARVLLIGQNLCDYWGFINPSVIALNTCGGSDRLLLVSTNDGHIVETLELGSEEMDGPPAASQNGRRFAIPTYHWGFGNDNPKKLFAHVFNVGSDRAIFTLEVQPHYTSKKNFHTPGGDTRFGWGGLALSPDGELLAVKSGSIVQVYQLPELGQASEVASSPPSASAKREGSAATAWPRAAAPRPPATPVVEALSWLPADTETVTAANGPFPLPELNREGGEESQGKGTNDEAADVFRGLSLGLFGFRQGTFEKYFKTAKIELAIEGARHFRPPSGLGGGPYEGADILVFSSDMTAAANSFMKDAPTTALRMDQIDGEAVAVFSEKMEEDTWTTYVAFPKPNLAVAATDQKYLSEVLARVRGKSGPRALPDNLAEWKYADTHAAFWAVRHYDKGGAGTDPTSPFGGVKTANISDDKATGLTFSFDPEKSPFATIAYLSGGRNAIAEEFAQVSTERGVNEMHAQYREVAPGVFQGRYNLSGDESVQIFGFVLMALLGHAVYL